MLPKDYPQRLEVASAKPPDAYDEGQYAPCVRLRSSLLISEARAFHGSIIASETVATFIKDNVFDVHFFTS